MRWLVSTIGKRGYIADYLRASAPDDTVIIGTGNERHTVGFLACDRAYLMVDIDEPGYIDQVLELCVSESIDAVLTLSDLDVERLAPARDRFVEQGMACFFPDARIAEMFQDKRLTAQLLSQRGFEVPRTWCDSDRALADGLRFPAVVKPCRGSASLGYSKIKDAGQLVAACARIEQPIVQEFVDGSLVNVEVCSDTDGHPLIASVWERLESTRGETGRAVTIDCPQALDVVERLLVEFPVPGPIDVDLIRTETGFVIIEVNTRFGGGYPVSHLAGADFPGAMLRSLHGMCPSRPFDDYRRGVTMMKALQPVEFVDGVLAVPARQSRMSS